MPICNITPFSAFVPTQDLLVGAEGIVYETLVTRVDPRVCVSHLQSLNGSQLSCGQLSPRFLVFHQNSLHPLQLTCHHAASMDLSLERHITFSVDQSVRELPPRRICLEVVELLGRIGGLAVERVDWRGVQWFTEHLVRVLAQCDHQWVRGHN